ncbi:MAG TPA: c-type cytochrome [Bacteroidales bacterium]
MKRLTIPIGLILIVIGILVLTEMQSCKHEPISGPGGGTVTTPTPTPTQSLNGDTLYANNCAGCHGPLASSAKLGATTSQIQLGINTISNMKSLSFLTSAQIQAIADVLKTTSTPPPVTDGATLYANNCAGCHGPLATSTKLNATAAQIQTGITTISQMSSLSTLTSTQIQAIANALVSTSTPPPVTDGATLYANYCASCHGPLATSAKLNATAAQIQTGISTVSQMSSLSTLTSTQIQAIATALVSTAPPVTDGATLYANNCASCHGPLATSTKIGATVTRIQNAISTVSQMNTLSTLTSTQIQAIATTLQSIPMPTDGPSLYAINCASCHGQLASSSVGSSSASEIQSAIKGQRQMNYLSFLTTTQIQTIASALAGIKGGDN